MVLEAQACGTPVIVSPFGGPKELVLEDETGWVVPNQDVKTWQTVMAEKIALAARDGERLNRMGARAREFAAGEYSLKNFINGLFSERAETSAQEN